MQLAALTLVMAGCAAAAPATVRKDVPPPQWGMKHFTRRCNAANTQCQFTYTISTGNGTLVPCHYGINATDASEASYDGMRCGVFGISSGWSGLHGPGLGVTTMAVTDNEGVIFPVYTDRQLANGTAVTPDQYYAPLSADDGESIGG